MENGAAHPSQEFRGVPPPDLALPHTVEDASIGPNLKKVVLRGHIMEVSFLCAQKIRTRDPDLFVDVTAEGQDWVCGQMSKGQALISPILP